MLSIHLRNETLRAVQPKLDVIDLMYTVTQNLVVGHSVASW